MALYTAIAATSQTIAGVLRRAATPGEFSGVSFEVYQGSDFATPMSQGVSVYLYRVTVNANRNLPARIGRDGNRHKPPIPLDLHYLVTAWAGDPVKQQRMLGFAIRALEDMPILASGLLNRNGPEPDVFRPEESVELVWESVPVQDLSDVWKVAQIKEQPSATYVARMVEIESGDTLAEHEPVRTREFQYVRMPE